MTDLHKPRPLRREERNLLEFLLSADFPGQEQLKEQLDRVEVKGECDCGCGTTYFHVKHPVVRALARGPIVVEAYGVGVDVLLFVRDGLMESMEIVYHGDAIPGFFPERDKLKLWVPPSST